MREGGTIRRRSGLDYGNGVEDNMVSVPITSPVVYLNFYYYVATSEGPKTNILCVSRYYWPLSKIAKAPHESTEIKKAQHLK